MHCGCHFQKHCKCIDVELYISPAENNPPRLIFYILQLASGLKNQNDVRMMSLQTSEIRQESCHFKHRHSIVLLAILGLFGDTNIIFIFASQINL